MVKFMLGSAGVKYLLGAYWLAAVMLCAAAGSQAQAQSQAMFSPIAIVNDSLVTGFDLSQRAQLLIALGFQAPDPESLRAEALESLIMDRLKIQEGTRLSLTPTAENIDAGIEGFAKRSGKSGVEFRELLNARGISEMALEDIVAADVVWAEVVRARFAHRIEPGEAEIDAEIALLQQRAGVSYRVVEIGLLVGDESGSSAEVQALAERLYTSLSQGGDFTAAVRRYSRSPSASRDGNIGWISSQKIPPELAEILSDMSPGQVARPFPVTGGFSILKLIEKRADSADSIDASNPELRERVRKRLSNQRIARLAEGLLQELRRDALIEIR